MAVLFLIAVYSTAYAVRAWLRQTFTQIADFLCF